MISSSLITHLKLYSLMHAGITEVHYSYDREHKF